MDDYKAWKWGQDSIILDIDSSAGEFRYGNSLFLDEAGTTPVDLKTVFTISGKEIATVSVGGGQGTIELVLPLDPDADAGIEVTIDPVWLYSQRHFSFGNYYAMVAKGRFQSESIQITFPD